MQPPLPAKPKSQPATVFHTPAILDAVLDGKSLTPDEALHLLKLTKEEDLRLLREVADTLCPRQAGETVGWTAGCSLFLTNLCELAPTIYPYPRQPGDAGVFTLSIDDIDASLELAENRKLDEIYVSGGGFWPYLQIPGLEKPEVLKTYARLLAYIRERQPRLRIIGLSPDEVDFLCVISDRSDRYVLELLKDQGLQALGGHGSGILSDSARRKISPKYAKIKRWFEIAAVARQLELPVTLKLEAGHYETPKDRINHLERVRVFLDKYPGAFSILVPQLFERNPQSASDWSGLRHAAPADRFKLLAVARLFLGEKLPVQQVFRQPDSLEEAQEGLTWGANYFGGTDAQAWHAFVMGGAPRSFLTPEMTADELQALIR